MAKKVIIVMMVMLTMATIYVGIRNDMVQRAEADDRITYTVNVFTNTEYGYVPSHDFEIMKPSLEVYIKMYWWEAEWLEGGDLLIRFDAEKNSWFILLDRNDPEINRLQKIIDEYGLKCRIPEK